MPKAPPVSTRRIVRLGAFRVPCVLLAMAALGCSTTRLAVTAQAEVMELAFPSIEEQSDYEFVGAAIPANLAQIEGLLRLQPQNERLLLLASRGLTSYAYGFIEDEVHRAELAGDLERADHQRARARAMYLKAKDYGLRLLRTLDSDFPEELPRDPDTLRALVQAEFRSAELAPALFWTGNAWGLAINLSRDDPSLLADLPFARVLVERSVELDEAYYHGSGHVFLGVVHSSLGQSMGGDPAKGRTHFEKALALTQRQASLVHVNYAQTFAVQTQDRELFVKLLEEVLAAPPAENSLLTLPNQIARRRAEQLLAQVDTLVLRSLDDLPPSGPSQKSPTDPPQPPSTGPSQPGPAESTDEATEPEPTSPPKPPVDAPAKPSATAP